MWPHRQAVSKLASVEFTCRPGGSRGRRKTCHHHSLLGAAQLRLERLEVRTMLSGTSFGSEQVIVQADIVGSPSSVVAADLNGDGDMDLLVGGGGGAGTEIGWYENTDGKGSFGSLRAIEQDGSGAHSVKAADMDGDGDLDVLVASGTNSGQIGWYENTDGNGAFGSQRLIGDNVYWPWSTDAADLDGDGDLDVITSSGFEYGDSQVTWYENTDSAGTFGAPRVISQDVEYPQSVIASDLDGDGDQDVIATSRYKIIWYANTDALGGFGTQQIISTEVRVASSVFTADLDRDGDLDLLSASSHDGKIAWYENTDELGSFGPQLVISEAAERAQSVYAADLDGDGDQDVLSASEFGDKLAWYKNIDGDGSIEFEQVISHEVEGAESVIAADLDADGDLDVVSASRGDSKLAWYLNSDGNGSFGNQSYIDQDKVFFPTDVVAADLDGDGDDDVLSASRDDHKIAWYPNVDGRGRFGSQRIISLDAFGAQEVHPADLDGDGDSDVLVVSHYGDRLSWYENIDGLGHFGPQHLISDTTFARTVDTADFDGDGDLDLVSGFGTRPRIVWFENTDGAGNFREAEIAISDASDPSTIVAADLDGDGAPDVLASFYSYQDETYHLAWFKNTGGVRRFGTLRDINVGDVGLFGDLHATDVDSDGDNDIVYDAVLYDESQQNFSIPLAWLKNTDGLGSFGAPNIIAEGNLLDTSVFPTDLDGDDDQDVLATFVNHVGWYENETGAGSYGPLQIISEQMDRPVSVKGADLDGDGDTDLLASSIFDNKVAWFENLLPPPGDANRDGRFNSTDLVQVFQIGEYEDAFENNSTWQEGDWNGDGDFDSGDLVLAFQRGLYEWHRQAVSPLLAAAVDQIHEQNDLGPFVP